MGYRIQYEYANLIVRKFRKSSILYNSVVLSATLIVATVGAHILCGIVQMLIAGQGSIVMKLSNMVIDDIQSGKTLMEAIHNVRELVYAS